MKKSTVSGPQPIPFRYSDLETDVAPPPAELPFLPRTDLAIIERAVQRVRALRESKKED
ncbi:MAG TPA: hypothetical protein VG297_01535 [Bryobacteraceae bacterium]|jgi:hypothetical protein|nr:hypothetical protein [Bryobacteraceae bacterium]